MLYLCRFALTNDRFSKKFLIKILYEFLFCSLRDTRIPRRDIDFTNLIKLENTKFIATNTFFNLQLFHSDTCIFASLHFQVLLINNLLSKDETT
jgi:hypothetical protein